MSSDTLIILAVMAALSIIALAVIVYRLKTRSRSSDLVDEEQLVARLNECEDLTGVGRTDEASLSKGYELLDEQHKRLWRALAVFPGTFEAGAARAVWGLRRIKRARKTLASFHVAGMVQWDAPAHRYRLNDLARDYAVGLLSAEERDDDGRRHAAYYGTVLRDAGALYLRGADAVLKGLSLSGAEWHNIRAGQAWAAAHREGDEDAACLCSEYADAGAYYLALRFHPREQIAWLEDAVEAARSRGNRLAEGSHLGNLGLVYTNLGDVRKGIDFCEQRIVIAREVGDRRGEGVALCALGNAHLLLGKTQKAMEFYRMSLKVVRDIGDRRGVGNVLCNLGSAHVSLGDARKSVEYFEKAVEIHRNTGDRCGEGHAVGGLGHACENLGETRKAIAYYERALEIHRDIDDRRAEGVNLASLGNAYLDLGDIHEAVAFYEQALGIARETGDRRGEGNALGGLGLAYARLGETHKAIEFQEQAIETSREVGDRSGEGIGLHNLADELAKSGHHDEAIARAERAMDIFEQIESPDAEKARALLARLREAPE